jgi:hypothetical protein
MDQSPSEKLIVTKLVMKFPAYYEIRRLITVFTTARDWSHSELVAVIILSKVLKYHYYYYYCFCCTIHARVLSKIGYSLRLQTYFMYHSILVFILPRQVG